MDQLCHHLEPLKIVKSLYIDIGFRGGTVVKNLPATAGDEDPQLQSLSQKDPLEEGMKTHSSILVWKIPWTEKPGRLQSKGSQRVRACNRILTLKNVISILSF